MARIEWMHTRLMNWARWKGGELSGGLGFASVSYDDGTTTSGYREAVIPVDACDASDTDQAVARLPGPMRAAVNVKYLGKLDPSSRAERWANTERDQLDRLACSRATLYARLDAADKLLAQDLESIRLRRKAARDHVEQMQAAVRPAAAA